MAEDDKKCDGIQSPEKVFDLERELDEYKIKYNDLKLKIDSATSALNSILNFNKDDLKISVAYKYRPFSDIGGDFLDIRNTANGVDILFADIAGHDMGASYYSIILKTLFAENCNQGDDGVTFFTNLNRTLLNIDPHGRAVTALFLRFNFSLMQLSIVSAAHPPLYFLGSNVKAVDAMTFKGSLLGVNDEVEFSPQKTNIRAGDRMLLFTDGFSNIFQSKSEDDRSRIARTGIEYLIDETRELPLEEMTENIFEKTLQFCSHKPGDDMLFLGVEIPTGLASDLFCLEEDKGVMNFRIASNLKMIDRLLTLVKDNLKQIGISDQLPFSMVLRELLVNAYEHGNKKDEEKNLFCRVEFSDSEITYVVEDQGDGFDHTAIDKTLSTDSEQTRSRGYGLIHYYSNEVSFNTTGNIVTAKIVIQLETTYTVSDVDISSDKNSDGRGDSIVGKVDKVGRADKADKTGKQITPSGQITAATVDNLRLLLIELLDSGTTQFTFNFENVSEIDSISISVFVAFSKMLKTENSSGTMNLINCSATILNFLKLTGLSEIFVINSSEE